MICGSGGIQLTTDELLATLLQRNDRRSQLSRLDGRAFLSELVFFVKLTTDMTVGNENAYQIPAHVGGAWTHVVDAGYKFQT